MSIKYYQAPITSKNISHYFFTRKGGISNGPYESLCFSYKRYSDADIQENIRRVENEIDIKPGYLKLANQVHSAEYLVINDPKIPTNEIAADAVITTLAEVAVGVMTADCCPILVWDEEAYIVAAIHAGWRGAAKGVIQNTIAKMKDMGANLKDIKVAIGPTIAQDSYEVDLPVYNEFKNADSFFATVPGKQDRWQFDLSGYCAGTLANIGVKQVYNMNLDTYTNEEEFFSCRRATHREEPGFGGHLSVIVLR